MGLETLAQLAIIGAAIAYGSASVFGRRFKSLGISPFQHRRGTGHSSHGYFNTARHLSSSAQSSWPTQA